MPTTTQAGNLSLRKLPKGDRASLYMVLVAGHMLVTLREAFAVAPGINSANVVVLRSGGIDAYGRPRLDCVMAGRWTRRAFDGVLWQHADAPTILSDTASNTITKIRSGELRPIDLANQPEIAMVIEQVDTTELLNTSAANA